MSERDRIARNIASGLASIPEFAFDADGLVKRAYQIADKLLAAATPEPQK